MAKIARSTVTKRGVLVASSYDDQESARSEDRQSWRYSSERSRLSLRMVGTVVAEYDLKSGDGATLFLAANAWGIHLSRSLQGAGGVGGLSARTYPSVTYGYTFDGNGNVSEVQSLSGTEAHYEYGPFGEPLKGSRAMTGNPFQFSTKYIGSGE